MSAVGERSLRQMPWWLWPTALCGFAPLAAWGWQSLFAEVANVRLHPSAHQVLALAAWVIALADRLLEAQHRRTWRHWFAKRYRVQLLLMLMAGCVILCWLLLKALSQVILESGLFLAVPVLFYLLFARAEVGPRAELPREIVRGALFSAGALMPTCRMAPVPPHALQLLIAQTLLISLIFVSATCRERLAVRQETPHREDWLAIDARLGMWSLLFLGALLWLAVIESGRPGKAMMTYYVAMAVLATVTLVLHGLRRRLSPDALHALSWVLLALPLVPGVLF